MSAARALSLVALLLGALAGAYWAGDHQRDNAWKAAQRDEVIAANRKYADEVKRGLEAAGNYIADLREQESRYDDLETRFKALQKRVQLLVQPAQKAPGSGVVVAELSLGAVWMWNSALAGANVPAHSCGADAATAEACALGSGLSLADAWDNHATNAQTCAADRLRYERLIDYLEGKKP
jgi:hypothetical protein